MFTKKIFELWNRGLFRIKFDDSFNFSRTYVSNSECWSGLLSNFKVAADTVRLCLLLYITMLSLCSPERVGWYFGPLKNTWITKVFGPTLWSRLWENIFPLLLSEAPMYASFQSCIWTDITVFQHVLVWLGKKEFARLSDLEAKHSSNILQMKTKALDQT